MALSLELLIKMAIPEDQLQSWSGRGAITSSASAYASIKIALETQGSKIYDSGAEIYLQGSYRNATNIRGDSDVDIVVELQSTFASDVSALDSSQRTTQAAAFESATYQWANFRADVLRTLQDYYGEARVQSSTKCIKVVTGPGRITADVVVAIQHRKYDYFYSMLLQSSSKGIQFFDSLRNPVINFPKQHIANGEEKNADGRTNGLFKPTVRVFKNARNRLITYELIRDSVCPSYCAECLVYNAPDSCFGGTCQETFANVFEYLWTLPFNKFISQNGLIPLFGSAPFQWNSDDASRFLDALRRLWLNWT
ncbi:MAG: nucleotidyltransferase [Nitrososphaerales archaeon]